MTNIKFRIAYAGNVLIKIFDVTGKEVAVLLKENLQAGTYEKRFFAGNLSSGIYFCRMLINKFMEIKKLIFLK